MILDKQKDEKVVGIDNEEKKERKEEKINRKYTFCCYKSNRRNLTWFEAYKERKAKWEAAQHQQKMDILGGL